MIASCDIVMALMRTEKSTQREPEGKYLFLVKTGANKVQVKNAVEELYKVKVRDVNTFVSAGKLKRVRHQLGRTADTKRAIVTLKKGEKIETGV